MPLPERTLYTDGACSPNPGVGGWGVIFLSGDSMVDEISGRDQETTNNRMELTAALRGLQHLKGPHRVVLVTDSTYVKNGITSWIHGWQRRGWLTADRQPVKNRDLWEALAGEIKRHRVDWQWVRGHSENRWNERVDALAVAARSRPAADGHNAPPPAADEDRIRIFSGITYSPGNHCGSWADILSYQQHVRMIGGAEQGGSANRFHLLAAVAGLLALKRELPVTLYTTSGYLRDGVHSWLDGWRQRNWRTSEGTPVSNTMLWRRLEPLLRTYEVEVRVVSRKDGFCLMQEAKELAREWQAAQGRQAVQPLT